MGWSIVQEAVGVPCNAVGWRLVLRTDSSAKVRWSSARTRPCMLALEGGLVHAIAKHAQGFRRVMCNFVVVYLEQRRLRGVVAVKMERRV